MTTGHKAVRRAAVAGQFYPADPLALEAVVRRYVEAAAIEDAAGAAKAFILPHAGYVYSGPIAASGYAWLRERPAVDRVVLIGPSHFVPVSGLAASSAHAFETPLGMVPVDEQAVARTLDLPQVRVVDAAHACEHSLEVHLPFLQCVLGEFTLVPLAAGTATAGEVAKVLDEIWGGRETVVIVSSDLSHYYDYPTAQEMDGATTRAIEELRPEGLGEESACGRVGIRGLLVVARRRGLRVRTLDVRSSGDTAGDRDAVVGYGAYAFLE